MDAIIIGRTLADAAITRDRALEQAKAEFERAVQRAAATAASRERLVARQYEAACAQARRVAGIRSGLWRQHHGLDSAELRLRLAVHEFRLSPAYEQQHLSGPQARAELWYVRMIRSELARRGFLPLQAPQEEAS